MDEVERLSRSVAHFVREVLDELKVEGQLPQHCSDFPEGCCGAVSEVLARVLPRFNLGPLVYRQGMIEGRTHGWIEVEGLIIDVTGDQFAGRPPVFVGTDDGWYPDSDESAELSAHLTPEEQQLLALIEGELDRVDAGRSLKPDESPRGNTS